MRVLIIGSNGQLGNELKKQISEGRSPIGLIPAAYSFAEAVGIDIEDLDVTDADAITAYIKNGCFDIIFNCAAMTNVDLCETEKEAAFRVNADAPGYIARAAAANGAKLIHVSTDYVFSGDSAVPRLEEDETKPRTVYGASKLLGERKVLESGADAAVVRTAWLYGAVGKNFVKTMIALALEKGQLKVVNDQLGNPTNAADLAHHLLKLGISAERGVFHCTNHGICSWYEFAVQIIKAANIDVPVTPCSTEEFPRPAPRPAYSALENARLRETVGDEMRDWDKAVYDYVVGFDLKHT